uniref:SMODS and SLOG-associating 2TM effector domain-containing protein n=1 Tax=viral metagenome TaxID=1070528 RepID=A0A6C0D6V7_9ZZZZ
MPNKDAVEKENEPTEKKKDPESVTVTSSQMIEKKVEWTEENEKIMAEWCDIAQCYKWLNTRAHQKYSVRHAWFTIPAITLSTISGTASFAQASLPVAYQSFAPMVIGAINIFIGILTTVQQYLKISELNESHRVAAISWDKFSRNIRIELAKAPLERMDCGSFLKISRQEFDRMMETSPSIPVPIVQEFISTFQGRPGTPERERFDALKKPDICNIIETVKGDMYDRSKDMVLDSPSVDFYSELEEKMMQREKLMQKKLHEISMELSRKEETERLHKEELEKQTKHKAELKETLKRAAMEVTAKIRIEHKRIESFIEDYESIYHRKPLAEDIRENFENNMESEILTKFLEGYSHDDAV